MQLIKTFTLRGPFISNSNDDRSFNQPSALITDWVFRLYFKDYVVIKSWAGETIKNITVAGKLAKYLYKYKGYKLINVDTGFRELDREFLYLMLE